MDLIAVLQKMGAIISYEPNRVILIEGVDTLRGYDHRCIFDRNEAASWACAALATDGDIFVGGAKQQEMLTFLNVFRKAGGWFDVHEDGIRFRRGGAAQARRRRDRRAPRLHDRLAAAAHRRAHAGRGRVDRARDRVREPARLHRGARADGRRHRRAPDGHRQSPTGACRAARSSRPPSSTGPTPLHGADVVVPDLRGGYSYLIAALAAEGESVVRNVGIIRRGYEKLFTKLDALGADFDVIG